MRFCLLDRIIDLQPGAKITAVKLLRPEEDYLRDHFPRFPVMPGVLMLETMYQAGMWLVRSSEDFQHAAILLKEARNVKYSDFVTPGKELLVTAELLKQDDTTATLKTQGTINGNVAVSARLVLEKFNIGDRFPARAMSDHYLRQWMKKVFLRLMQPVPEPNPSSPHPHFQVNSHLVSAQP
ncbi:3-hydroxyacyl-[acyl-carrier-protein] dehydratase FabZ [Anatilimnocola aggregata]|uniref:3-hydroxyacyl-[acyl-carrier-protein] dehydratase FabZ n=1 Tax=Anatilimnocola aggregata TaxID=2528021 RepID=A0A517YJI1_9BACT|nr:3-hydroxyacyl-ACP dehydratase FabZ family protein [Anatilimnocola aggregata]QDU30380.1 3-hydroxyacyl-[acyl-carrier-protein] dehydratase FabZ [Anatilimnocola aggregata]